MLDQIMNNPQQLNTQNLKLITALHAIGCVKFGQFKLKSGLMSPIYIDLRLLVTHPDVLKQAAQAMAGLINSEQGTVNSASFPIASLPFPTPACPSALQLRWRRTSR